MHPEIKLYQFYKTKNMLLNNRLYFSDFKNNNFQNVYRKLNYGGH